MSNIRIALSTAWANTKLVFDPRLSASESYRRQQENHIHSLVARGASDRRVAKARRDYERTVRVLG